MFDNMSTVFSKEGVVFGSVDASRDGPLAARYSLNGYPSFVWFGVGNASHFDPNNAKEVVVLHQSVLKTRSDFEKFFSENLWRDSVWEKKEKPADAEVLALVQDFCAVSSKAKKKRLAALDLQLGSSKWDIDWETDALLYMTKMVRQGQDAQSFRANELARLDALLLNTEMDVIGRESHRKRRRALSEMCVSIEEGVIQ